MQAIALPACFRLYSNHSAFRECGRSKQKRYQYDGLGRLVNVREDPHGLNYSTSYYYDALDHLTAVSQGYCPACQSRWFGYDNAGRLTSASNPESGTVQYAYDGVGNLQARSDARGIVTNYTYDPLDRLQTVAYSDGTPAVTYTYDAPGLLYAKGQLASVGTVDSVTRFTGFDALGRVAASQQETEGQTYRFAYTYNRAGALASETYPSGRVVTTSYDGANRPTQLTGARNGQNQTYLAQAVYGSQGAPQSYLYGNTVGYRASYNARLQPTILTHALNNQDSSLLLRLSPNWGTTNNNGTLQSLLQENGGSSVQQSFTYDPVNRLQTATDTGGWSRRFTYDAYGNG